MDRMGGDGCVDLIVVIITQCIHTQITMLYTVSILNPYL